MKELTKQTFDENAQEGLQVISFESDECPACQRQRPVLNELAEELRVVDFSKVNVARETELVARFSVQSTPTLLIFLDGRLVDRLIGVREKKALKKEITYYF